MNSKYLTTNKNNPVFYNGSQLSGFILKQDGQEIYYSPRRMSIIFNHYENLLMQEKFNPAVNIEKSRKLPKTWLNYIIADLIKDNENCLDEKLISEFKDRGFKDEN